MGSHPACIYGQGLGTVQIDRKRQELRSLLHTGGQVETQDLILHILAVKKADKMRDGNHVYRGEGFGFHAQQTQLQRKFIFGYFQIGIKSLTVPRQNLFGLFI